MEPTYGKSEPGRDRGTGEVQTDEQTHESKYESCVWQDQHFDRVYHQQR